MSLPGSAIEQLREQNLQRKMQAEEWIKELESALERANLVIDDLKRENSVLRRRVESLEGVSQ